MQESRAEVGLPGRRGVRWLRLLAFGCLAVGLLWAIATHSLVAALVGIDPLRALSIRSDDPAALLARADRAFASSRATRGPGSAPATESEVVLRRERDAELRRSAVAIIELEPGNARALAILGDIARRSGADEVARTFFGASARRSMREPVVLGWLIDDALKRQDWALAMRHLDTMMRYYSEAVTPLTPLLAKLLQNPDAAPAVVEALAAAPEWRREFIPRLSGAVADVRVPLELFVALKATSSPPTVAELRLYFSFLLERHYYDLAYYTWLQFLGAEQLARVGPLFNGSFESRPTGLPFDWVPAREKGADVSIERRANRPSEQTLVIRLGPGRAELDYIGQLMRLQPGHHRVEGLAMGDLQGPRGMRWRVRCLGSPGSQIGESAMLGGRVATWTTFAFDVAVPENGCAAQELRLVLDARTPSEQLVSGTISFDALSVRRLP